MDFQELLNRLEYAVDEGRHVFGTKYTVVHEDQLLATIDQLRASIPEEIEKAARTLNQRDRVLADANEEAARIVQQARQHSEDLVDEQEMVKQATLRAEYIVDQAKIEAQRITREADEYVVEQLSQLEHHFAQTLQVIRNGIAHMQPQAPAAAALPATPELQEYDANQSSENSEPIRFERPSQAPMGGRV